MGIAKTTIKKPANPFMKGSNSCLSGKSTTKEIVVRDITLSDLMSAIGFESNDVIITANNTDYNRDRLRQCMTCLVYTSTCVLETRA